GVGPFVEQGAVESFDFAVGLGPVGACALVGGAAGGECLAEDTGAVAGSVIGEYTVDMLDSHAREEGRCPGPESGGGVLFLVGLYLGVGQPRVVIDGVVAVAIA